MNYWTDLSIQYANQKSYLDDLFSVYPTIPDGIREMNTTAWDKIENAFNLKNNDSLIKELLKLDLFPIKDSYVAYLKRDLTSIDRNPRTINRLSGRIYEMGLDKILEKCTEPKETNRQIGPFFRRWLKSGALGVVPVPMAEFVKTNDDAILDAGDAEMMAFARKNLNYTREKGLDFVARFKGKYIIGEAKFLTDFGGHQNAQFADAMSTISDPTVNAIMVAVLDGVVWIPRGKMYKEAIKHPERNIMSSLVLREFIYQL
jgi:hypothetical protein